MDKNNKVDTKRKLLAAGLGVLAVFIIILWVVDLKASVSTPQEVIQNNIDEQNPSLSQSESSCPDGNCDTTNNQGTTDTDNDGLTDTQEEQVYNTSPYLKDTDSDGINDKEEIEQGTDPNCPQGQNCNNDLNNPASQARSGQSTSTSMNKLFGGLSNSSSRVPTSTSDSPASLPSDIDPQKVLQGEASVEEIREIMSQSGISQQQLNQINDQSLKKLYQQSLPNQ